ncbi:MAG: hypothetical protein ACREYE_08015 [Gammaproteobacteria bacterium]
MSETIAITGKSVKLFKGHYTSLGAAPIPEAQRAGSLSILPRICSNRRNIISSS